MTHFVGALSEDDLAFELSTTVHDDLRRPASQLGFATQGAEGVPRDSRHQFGLNDAWRDLCANRRRPADLPGLSMARARSCEPARPCAAQPGHVT